MTPSFRGSTVALVTPFDLDGAIDEAALRRLVDRQIDGGTDVLLAGGTTGESATLSHDEHHRVMEIIIDQAGGRVPILCGAGSNATHEAVSLTRHAEKSGADAVLSVVPYYNKPGQAGLVAHFRAVAQATSLPVILYNVPGRTSCNLRPETVLELADIPNIIGIKEASGDLDQMMSILQQRPADFLVLSGDDALTFPLLALGGDGVISVAANQVPDLVRQLVWAALEGDWLQARELHYRLLPLMRINFIETNPVPVKTALALMGVIGPTLRLPLTPMRPENRNRLAAVLLDLQLIGGGQR